MKWWWLLFVGVALARGATERELFVALGARDLPARGWMSVAEARARVQEEAARLKLKRAAGAPDVQAEGWLARLESILGRRAAAAGVPPAPVVVASPAPRPLFGAQSPRVLVCKYRGGLDPCYHRPGCAHLRGIVSWMDLAEARRSCTPCPACRGGSARG